MEGVNILQTVAGEIPLAPVLIIIGCSIFVILGIIALCLGETDDWTIMIISVSIIIIFLAIGTIRIIRIENPYYYATIEDSVSLKEFDKYYIIIKHEDNSELWLIKEKEISENDD